VFLSILAIESIILIPSAYNFKTNAIQLLEQKATTAIHASLLIAGLPNAPDQWAQRLKALEGHESILGLAVIQPDGDLLARAGSVEFSGFDLQALLQGPETAMRRTDSTGNYHELALRENVRDGALIFIIRLDSSEVKSELLAYVLRIAGLVALIVAVVTIGTMLVLYRTVLDPVLKLRQSIVGAANDPDHAEQFQLEVQSTDELGEVFAAHNHMLSRVTESKRADRLHAEENARFLTMHDSLTDLPNRNFFLEHLDRVLPEAGKQRHEIHVLVLNLVGFSQINDALGQGIGDKVLGEVAQRLRRTLLAKQFLARLGGDEFALVTTGQSDAAQAARYAESLITTLKKGLMLDGNEIRLRVRVGVTCITQYGMGAETVLHDAQVAMRRADADAGSSYQFFSPEMTMEAQQRREIEYELRNAMEKGNLLLHFQPKIPLTPAPADDSVISCEALLRWPHATRGWISPAEFIPVAEDCGLITVLGEWVLREACLQIRRWQDAGLSAPRVAVNVAAQQFRDLGFQKIVRSAINAAAIDPDLLEFEITESAAMGDVSLTMAVLASLRDIGVRLSIDDFGTGYSSLSYLCKFEFDTLKIDKSFVDDIGKNANADAICDAIIRLGQSLGKKLVAEGVETETQAEFLRQRRCNEAQGYLFARPMPADEIAKKLPASHIESGT